MEQLPKKLLDQVRDVIRLKHYSTRTEQELLGHKDVKTMMTRSAPTS